MEISSNKFLGFFLGFFVMGLGLTLEKNQLIIGGFFIAAVFFLYPRIKKDRY